MASKKNAMADMAGDTFTNVRYVSRNDKIRFKMPSSDHFYVTFTVVAFMQFVCL